MKAILLLVEYVFIADAESLIVAPHPTYGIQILTSGARIPDMQPTPALFCSSSRGYLDNAGDQRDAIRAFASGLAGLTSVLWRVLLPGRCRR